MILEITDKNKVAQLGIIFTNLKNMCEHMNFKIGKNGLYTQGMDSTHICCMELNLIPEWFDKIKIPSDNGEYKIGLDCGMLEKVFKCLENGQSIKITFMENSTAELLIYFEGKGHDKMFELPLIEIDVDELVIPSADYSADIIIKSDEYKHILSQLVKFGDTVLYKLGFDDYIYMRTEGNVGKMQVRIKEENIVEYALEDEKMFTISYGIRFIEKFCNFSKLNQHINMHISEEFPMKLQFNLSNWKETNDDEDNFNEQNYIKTYIAPLIGDDDD